MAHLLGSKTCLESLKQDVNDVQATVGDLLSRVGPVRSPSWKYPDKIACELDIEELLERYSYLMTRIIVNCHILSCFNC